MNFHQHLSEAQVRALAGSTHVKLTDNEIAQMTIDLNAMIDGLKPITEFDLEGVSPTYHPIEVLVNVMRDDVEVEGLTQDEALRNASNVKDGCFLVPSILGKRPACQ